MSVAAPKIPPVAIWLLSGALMGLVTWAAPAWSYVLPASRVIAGCLALVGVSTAVWGAAAFRHARTTVNPLRPEKASSLVATGIYRVSRNPMYLGLLVMLLGWAVFLSNAVAFVGLPAFVLVMNRGQIAAEERALETLFGPAFVAYRSEVRRWL